MQAGQEAPEVARAVASAVIQWFSVDKRARLVVTADLSVIWSNDAARRLLGRGRPVAISDGSLVTRNGTIHQALARLVEEVDGQLGTAVLDWGENSRLLVRAVGSGATIARAVCLEMVLDRPSDPPAFADIDLAFALTAAEHQVVLGLLQGRRVTELARAKRVSVDTVRSQMRSIYAKANVASREELFSRLWRYCIS